jgi:hypothetical protein
VWLLSLKAKYSNVLINAFITGKYDCLDKQIEYIGKKRHARMNDSKSIKKIRTENFWQKD